MDRIDEVLQRMRQPQAAVAPPAGTSAPKSPGNVKASSRLRIPAALPRWLPFLAVVPLLVVAFVMWRTTPAAQAPVAAPIAPPSQTSASWITVVQELSTRRQLALRKLDTSALVALYAPGSEALAADLALIERLRAEQRVPGPSTITVETADERWFAEQAAGDRLSLRVTDRMSAYAVLDAQGKVVQSVPARGSRTWRIELLRTAERWRIVSVAAEPRAAS